MSTSTTNRPRARSPMATLPGQPVAAAPPPARPWSWSLEPEALPDAEGDAWWASLRPLPLRQDDEAEQGLEAAAPAPEPETAAPAADSVQPARAEAAPSRTLSSAPPPAMICDLLLAPAPSRSWLMPALVATAALVVGLGGAAAESASSGLEQAAALEGAAEGPALGQLPTLDARTELARVGAVGRLRIDRALRAQHPPPTQLLVSSSRPCAQIWLDAHLRGSGQGRTFGVTPGAHAVACRLPSGQMFVRRAVVAEGQTVAVFFGP